MKMYATSDLRCSPAEFAALVGVSYKTLYRWDRSGKLKAGRYPSDRRYYTASHYASCGGDPADFRDMLRSSGQAAHEEGGGGT